MFSIQFKCMHFCSDKNVRCVHCVFPPYCILMINNDNATKHGSL